MPKGKIIFLLSRRLLSSLTPTLLSLTHKPQKITTIPIKTQLQIDSSKCIIRMGVVQGLHLRLLLLHHQFIKVKFHKVFQRVQLEEGQEVCLTTLTLRCPEYQYFRNALHVVFKAIRVYNSKSGIVQFGVVWECFA